MSASQFSTGRVLIPVSAGPDLLNRVVCYHWQKVQQHESANRTGGLIRGCSGIAEMGVKNKARPAP